jgi:class 3 adenylate cyclase
MSCLSFLGFITSLTHWDWELMIWTEFLFIIFRAFAVSSLAAVIYLVFYSKIQKQFWFILAGSIFLIIISIWKPESNLILLRIFGAVVGLEMLRVIVRAVIKKQDGAWAFGLGGALTGFAWGLNVLTSVVLFESSYRTILISFSNSVIILALPIAMSVFLASRFARISYNLEEQLVQVKELSRKQLALEQEKKKLVEAQKDQLEIEVAERTNELRMQKEETERLLYNILPMDIAKELQEKGTSIPRRFEEISVLFSDFKGFTNTVATMPAHRLVEELNDIFRVFDDIIDRHGIEKIKTIGDSYLIAAGLPKESENHAIQCVKVALEMIRHIDKRNETSAIKWLMRVGIHSGSVIAGVVGKKKFTYDVWGDTVNIAQRMEASGIPGKVNISAHTFHLVKNEFNCEYRGKIDAKGKGEIDMYFVLGEKDS